jgi:hypothetical protein
MLIAKVPGSRETGSLLALVPCTLMVSWMKGRILFISVVSLLCGLLNLKVNNVLPLSYRFKMSVEEAGELARRAIYHATFRDGASGGCVSGML